MPAADPKAYGSSWYEATVVASPPRGRLTVELDVDVCVVGAGLAGLTVAREVARRGWSVVVLEAQTVAWNASGRNSGFVLPGYSADADAIAARVGPDQAKSLWELSVAGLEYVRNTIRETEMPGADLTEGGWLHVSKFNDDGEIRQYADLLSGETGAAAEYWPADRVRETLRSPLYFSGIHYPQAFAINTLNYALGLAAAAEAAGARIYEQTAALEIDPAGVRKRIVTPAARVRAGHVVLAGNMHLRDLMPQIAATLLPIWTYIVTTAPLGDALHDAIRYPGAVSDTNLADNHYRIVGGDRLMWSGRSTVWRGNPRRYLNALLGDLARAYPQLGKVKAEYAWTGALGNTVHRMPNIGEISPGFWLLSGFGGHGLNTTAMGGDIVARAIVEGDQTWRQFSPFDLVWAGGLYGRAGQQAYYWSHHVKERFGGKAARKRDIAQRHDEERRRIMAEQAAAAPVPASPEPQPAAETAPGPALEALSFLGDLYGRAAQRAQDLSRIVQARIGDKLAQRREATLRHDEERGRAMAEKAATEPAAAPPQPPPAAIEASPDAVAEVPNGSAEAAASAPKKPKTTHSKTTHPKAAAGPKTAALAKPAARPKVRRRKRRRIKRDRDSAAPTLEDGGLPPASNTPADGS